MGPWIESTLCFIDENSKINHGKIQIKEELGSIVATYRKYMLFIRNEWKISIISPFFILCYSDFLMIVLCHKRSMYFLNLYTIWIFYSVTFQSIFLSDCMNFSFILSSYTGFMIFFSQKCKNKYKSQTLHAKY